MSDAMGQMFRDEMMHTTLSLEAEERERQSKLPSPAGSLSSHDRIKLMKPLADEAHRVITIGKQSGDAQLIDAGLATLAAIFQAI